jgi:DNA-directed RNA polymerase subunit E'
MYKIMRIKDDVSVSPSLLSLGIEEAVKQSLSDKIEGKIEQDVGVILSIINITEIGEGKIFPENPDVHCETTFDALVFYPEDQEIIYGVVVDITDIGAFVRIGPLDGFVHISQIMNDKVVYDQKNSILIGKKTKKKLQEGDIVRARIISVSLGKDKTKIGLTMRQPMLGSLKWIESEKREMKKKAKK